MNKKALMVVAGAFIIAIIVALIVQSKLAPQKEMTELRQVEILVATKDISAGAKLKREDVKWQAWPEDAVFSGVYKKSDYPDVTKLDIYDQMVSRPIIKGEPITAAAIIADSKAGSMIAAKMMPGMRAISVKINAETGVSGFVGPGDRVDVLLTYQIKARGETQRAAENIAQRIATQTILSNVRVLAVDQTAKEDANREIKIGKNATLEVTKEQAQLIALSAKMGDLSLTLRRVGDVDNPADRSVVTTDVMASDVLREAAHMTKRAKIETNSVRLYEGANVRNIPVRKAEPTKSTNPQGGE
jgi:pilus assembly protein CpaB